MITYFLSNCCNNVSFHWLRIYFCLLFTVEKGTVVADYSAGVGSNTLVFTSQECYRLFEIDGSRLLLKENLLDQSVCVSFFYLLLVFKKVYQLQHVFILAEKKFK